MSDVESPILSHLGSDPEDIAKGLRESSKSAGTLSSDRPRLIDQHPLRWIGVYRGEVSAKAGDLPTLIEETGEAGHSAWQHDRTIHRGEPANADPLDSLRDPDLTI